MSNSEQQNSFNSDSDISYEEAISRPNLLTGSLQPANPRFTFGFGQATTQPANPRFTFGSRQSGTQPEFEGFGRRSTRNEEPVRPNLLAGSSQPGSPRFTIGSRPDIPRLFRSSTFGDMESATEINTQPEFEGFGRRSTRNEEPVRPNLLAGSSQPATREEEIQGQNFGEPMSISEFASFFRNIPVPTFQPQEASIEPEGSDDDDDEEYIFEEADDVNEADITNTTCYDIISADYEDIIKHLNEENTFLLINKSSNNTFDILCLDKNYIEYMVNNKNGNWFYECTGNIIPGTNNKPMGQFGTEAYVKISHPQGLFNAYIPLVQLKTLLRKDNRIYYIYPLMEGNSHKKLTHTIGWQNSYGPSQNRNIVSAYHCQSGTEAPIYTLKLCRDPERCIKSIIQ
jgi:hypothetical protein